MKIQSTSGDKYRFPWRSGNHFTALKDGDVFFHRMLNAIESARQYILLEMYLVESGQIANKFINALSSAAQRGVVIYVLIDDYGSLELDSEDKQKILRAGIHLTYYNPLSSHSYLYNVYQILWQKVDRHLYRDHRKLLLIDGKLAYVGGAGITDDFDPPVTPKMRWRETMLEIKGPVIQDWQSLFKESWDLYAQEKLSLAFDNTECFSDDSYGRVITSEGFKCQEISRSLIKRIRSAEHRVWFATAYFVPSWTIRRALRYAAKRGADVRLLLPGPYTDHPSVRHVGRRFYTRLLRHGVKVFEYQPRFMHAKTVLCDNWVSIGSSNLDQWNLRWNLEANQEIDDSNFAGEIQQILEEDFTKCHQFTYSEWRRRAPYLRLMEWFWRRIGLLIIKLTDRIKSKR